MHQVADSAYHDAGDFALTPYAHEVSQSEGRVVLTMSRTGRVESGGGGVPVRLEKTVDLEAKSAAIHAVYRLTNEGDATLSAILAVEFGIGLQTGDSPECHYYGEDDQPIGGLGVKSEFAETGAIGVVDKAQDIDVRVRWSAPAAVWVYPIRCVSQSEAGLEPAYQSSVILPRWRIRLAPGEQWEAEIWKEIRQ